MKTTVESCIVDQSDLLGEILSWLCQPFLEPLHGDPCLAPGLEVHVIEVFTLSWAPFDDLVDNRSTSCSFVSDTFDPLLEDSPPIFVISRVVEEVLKYVLASFTVEIVGKAEDLVTPVVSKIDHVSEQAM